MAITSTRKALIDQVLAEKQANIDLTNQVFNECLRVQQRAAIDGNEAAMWAAGIYARRARVAFDEIVANLDRRLERLQVEGSA
jgi:hypothetical protein